MQTKGIKLQYQLKINGTHPFYWIYALHASILQPYSLQAISRQIAALQTSPCTEIETTISQKNRVISSYFI
jgi:hypothetical protein